jgi:hypothetical protein
MPSFAQVLLRPRKASRQSRPISLLVPPLTFRLVTWQRTSFSELLVCSGISGRSSTMSTLVGMKPCEQTIEGDESGLAREDAVEACPQGSSALPARILSIGFEVAIERPDQFTNAGLRFALLIGEGIECVNETLGMNPA